MSDDDTTDFAYTYYVPRVTSATNLRFAVRVDGSAKNVHCQLSQVLKLLVFLQRNLVGYYMFDSPGHACGQVGDALQVTVDLDDCA